MKSLRILFFIFFLALIVRVFELSAFPVGFHADEVRVGWNAYSILKTGQDDRGNSLAFYYDTFGDYRPTGIFYMTMPSIIIFGLNEFAVRFPSALFGALSIFPIYFLAFWITKQKSIGLLSAFFLALSVWHISASRATSEVVISTFFALIAIALLIRAIQKNRSSLFCFSIIFFAISYVFYHSIRLLAPLFVAVIFLWYFKKISIQTRERLLLTFIGTVFLTLTFVSSAGGRGRFSQVSILQLRSPSKTFLTEYSSYFSGEFLFGDAAKPIRYKSPDIGMLLFAEIIFLGIGVVLIIRGKAHPLLLFLLLCSPIPAALTQEDSPNLHRSFFMTIFFSILAGFGADYLLQKKKLLFALLFVFFATQWGFFWHSYSTKSGSLVGAVRNEALKPLVLYLNEVQNNYKKIVITNDPDDPYPWYAFFTNKNPQEFNSFATQRLIGPWEYQNLLFTRKECPSGDIFPDKFGQPLKENILVVDSFKCPVESKIHDGMQAKVVKQFFNSDGSIAYTLWEKI